jgi:hypothetical protein
MFKVFIDKKRMKLSNGIDHLGYHSELILSMRVTRDAHDKCLYPDSTELEDFIKYIGAYKPNEDGGLSIMDITSSTFSVNVAGKSVDLVTLDSDGDLTISNELAQAIKRKFLY